MVLLLYCFGCWLRNANNRKRDSYLPSLPQATSESLQNKKSMNSILQRRLEAGQFVITGEIAPPKGAGRAGLEKMAEALRGSVDAINLTDNQRGLGRMSSLGAGVILQQLGFETIMQMTCQHRNRIALQADALSAAACGINNIVCMTGDHPRIGDHPEAKNVLDLNSFQLVKIMRSLRDDGAFQSGVALNEAPRYFLGAVANPNIERAARLEKKIEAGAEFVQTQILFDMERFHSWMNDARAVSLHQRAHILGGILVLRSAQQARFLRDHLPGSRVPDWVVERMDRAEDAECEGINIASELTRELLATDGVHGVHLMSVGWTKAIPRVVAAAGVLPRPTAPAA